MKRYGEQQERLSYLSASGKREKKSTRSLVKLNLNSKFIQTLGACTQFKPVNQQFP